MDFYVVEMSPKGESELYRTDFFYDESVNKGEALKCPKCGGYVSMLPPLPPYLVHLETWGQGFGDTAFGPSDFLVSLRFKEAYERSRLRGLASFEKVEALSYKSYGTAKDQPPEYFRTMPSLNAAKVDIEASGVEWKAGRAPTCDECLSGLIKRWHRVLVDEKSWNGDDIFYAYGIPGRLLVSSRFFEWASEHQFRNLVLCPSEESSHDFYPWEATAGQPPPA